MKVPEPEAHFVIFRRLADKTLVALFPQTPGTGSPEHCFALVDGTGPRSVPYTRTMRESRAVKPKQYRDFLANVRTQFAHDFAEKELRVIQRASDLMHDIRKQQFAAKKAAEVRDDRLHD